MKQEIDIKLGSGALKYLGEQLQGVDSAMVVCDENTYKAAGENVLHLLKNTARVKADLCVLRNADGKGALIPNENALGQIMINVGHDTKLLIAVGSGTINDLTKYTSFKLKIPYGIVATAASMDGYASSVSPLIVGGFKRTYGATYPKFIIGDTDIIKEAPFAMTQAGFGDILGKYTALADWYLGHVLLDETYPEDVVSMVVSSIEKCVDSCALLKEKNTEAVYNVMNALVTSGLAMLKYGNSRPASGAEHHISHYLEMKDLLSAAPHGGATRFHGTKVGVAVVIISDIYKKLFSHDKDDIVKLIRLRKEENEDEYMSRIKASFGPLSEEVLDETEKYYLDRNLRRIRQEKIIENWDKMKKFVSEKVPEPDFLKRLLDSIDAPSGIDDIGGFNVGDAVINAKEVRKRYTVLRLIEDIGFKYKV